MHRQKNAIGKVFSIRMITGCLELILPPYRCERVTTPSFARLWSGFLLFENEMATDLFWLRSSLWMCSAIMCTLALTVVSGAWAQKLSGRVVGVTDGDTITLLDERNVQHKIRLAGIDAPERKQPFGQRSKEELSELVAGKSVEVETEKLDRYGRTVGKVIAGGRDANLTMVMSGLAWHYKKYEHEQSPSDRLLYDSAEKDARASRRGLWADQGPIAPSDWRTGTR